MHIDIDFLLLTKAGKGKKIHSLYKKFISCAKKGKKSSLNPEKTRGNSKQVDIKLNGKSFIRGKNVRTSQGIDEARCQFVI